MRGEWRANDCRIWIWGRFSLLEMRPRPSVSTARLVVARQSLGRLFVTHWSGCYSELWTSLALALAIEHHTDRDFLF